MNTLLAQYLIEKTVGERHEVAMQHSSVLAALNAQPQFPRFWSRPAAFHFQHFRSLFKGFGGSSTTIAAEAECARP